LAAPFEEFAMPAARPVFHPFMLIVDPQAVLQCIERSERLERLERRVCHPLDKVVMPTVLAGAPEAGDRSSDEPFEADTPA
jgi:hypothetical protein